MDALSQLTAVGLSHRSAPVELRERLAVPAGTLGAAVSDLRQACEAREAVLLSTCNRVEVYAVGEAGRGLHERVIAALAARAGTGAAELEPHLRIHAGVDAMAHLVRVASSLDSLVVGEPQILGQVKDAFDAASAAGCIGALLGDCFREAFKIAKRVRTETEIARNPVSISSVAVDLARQVFGGFEGKTVLLIGAGEMADLAARALASKGASLVVTNRTASRARELAASVGGTAHPFEDLTGVLHRADVVIASTGAPHPILTHAMVGAVQRGRRGRPLLLVDIAVPRDVEPSVSRIEGVYVADIDDLEKVVAQHRQSRRGEAERAERMVEEELQRYLRTRSSRSVGPLIATLRGRVLELCRGESERTLHNLTGLGERERAEIRQMAERIAAKLLHEPQMALKRDAAEGQGVLAAAAEQLFGLSGRPADAAAGSGMPAEPEQPAETPPTAASAGSGGSVD